MHTLRTHPLDKLINNDSLFLMEALVPFVDSSLRMPLAVYIKVTELQLLIKALQNNTYVNNCGFCRDFHNEKDILSALSECGYGDIAGQMSQMKSAMEMMNVMNAMYSTEASEPSGMSDNATDNFTNGSVNNPFYDSQPAMGGTGTINNDSPPLQNDAGTMFDNIMSILDEYDASDSHETGPP